MANFTLSSLRGGVNTSDPPSFLPEDQCLEAMNVEFNRSTLGERRRGATAISLTASGITGHTRVSWLFRHLPTADQADAQLWVLGLTPASSTTLVYKDTTWHTVVPFDAIGFVGKEPYHLYGQSLNGKLYITYKSVVDRMHVWDGTSLRRVGIAAPSAAPTSANTAVAGTFTGVRYYRVRYTVQSAGATLRRSEPSASLTVTPPGVWTGLIITKPAATVEGETHWELEASKDNVLFYVLATTLVGTTTVTDTTLYATGYGAGVLSEDIGDYTLPYSAKFVVADEDRLVFGGSLENTPEGIAYRSRISWTPVVNDPGKGNAERIPIDTDNYIDLNNLDGGGLTALSQPFNGYIYAFKLGHIYKLVRTGIRTRAYEAVCITKERGAIEGSLVNGIDQEGRPALYFVDPCVGPCRIGANGLQTCGIDILETSCSINVNATELTCVGCFYPETRQIHWWVATAAANSPNLKLVLQTNECRETEDGVRRGWSFGNGLSAAPYAAVSFADNIDAAVARSLRLRPLIGVSSAGTTLIWQLDSGTTDNGTDFAAVLTSRPFSPTGILNKFGIMAGAILATAAAGVSVNVTIRRDFGIQTDKTVAVLLTPVGSEIQVIKQIDDLRMSELHSIQIRFSDLATPTGRWELNNFELKQRAEETL